MKQTIRKTDILVLLGVFALAFLVMFGIQRISGRIDGVASMVFVLAVFLISIYTDGYFWGVMASLLSVLAVNFAFRSPYFAFNFTLPENLFSGLVMLVVSIMTSTLTTRIKMQEQLRMESETEKMRANLLRAVSHDLRTPLTSISGNASNLLSNGNLFDTKTKEQMCMDIYDDAMWLIDLVENLLSVSRLEDGRMNLHISTELIDEVVAEALRHVDRRCAQYNLRVQNSEEYLLAQIDAKLIVQVLINLINNAIKYTPPGTEIDIAWERRGGWLQVSVSDTGPGVSDQAKPHIFDMFYSASDPIADSRRSMGLGLALCKSIINAHGGEIAVADRSPHGAIFTFSVPAGEVELHE